MNETPINQFMADIFTGRKCVLLCITAVEKASSSIFSRGRCVKEKWYMPILLRLFDALDWNASKEQTCQSIKIQIIFRNIINKNTNHHYRCDIKVNRGDEKTFKIIHNTTKYVHHMAAEKKVSGFFFQYQLSD